MKSELYLVCLAGMMFMLAMFRSAAAEIAVLDNGDKIAWDGEYYDFRDADNVKMIKLWVPPNTDPVRGVFISGHGGGSGDSRNFARDENIRAFAMRLGFAVAGLHNFPGRRVYNEGAPVFFHALDAFAELGHHPELANIPFVVYGSSNGGATTYGFVNYAPERAICFVANVGAGYNPKEPVDAALKVPGVHIIGKFDALVGERGMRRTSEMMANVRPQGALWSWALTLKGHEDGNSFDLYMKLVEEAVAARYPESEDPRKGVVHLAEIHEQDGWLVEQGNWDDGLTCIDSYQQYQGDKNKAGWVLNKDLAYIFRTLPTYPHPLSLSVREFDRTFNPHTDPGTMFSLGGPVADPGETITICCNAEDFPDWQQIDFYNGARKLGTVKSGDEPKITITLKPENQVYCLNALATDQSDVQRVSAPMHFFVRDPELSWHADLSEPVFSGAKTNAGSKNAGMDIKATPPDPQDNILTAYGLHAAHERQFSAKDGRLSAFWDSDAMLDSIRLSQRMNAAPDAVFNFVLTHDCNMTVKAAYGADGIYLLYIINDDNDVAWPNRFVGTENEQFYLNFDVVDALMDNRSVNELVRAHGSGEFVSRGFGLTLNTRQYQVACGTKKERPTGFKRSMADPWDFHAAYHTFENARKQFGIQIENISLDAFHKAQEWFIPWSEYGGGLQGEPDAGTRLAFTAGFNDRDAGEHFPPGVTSSGGSVKASNALRWIDKTDPWGASEPPFAWGEIELGPMLEFAQ